MKESRAYASLNQEFKIKHYCIFEGEESRAWRWGLEVDHGESTRSQVDDEHR
jgi:hypothetical protein